ncbi:MAG: FAD-binding protein [Clostridia bacterium]|nr:FAD-binding protein [Clostridia bacterium]
MNTETFEYWGKTYEVPKLSYHTVIVGTGAAGYNAADSLHALGVTDIAILTEGVNMGTSRNTGSDKQTYYKLTMAGGMPDSVRGMAQTLFDCGSMHGDIALCEAAGSPRAFFKLVSLGVPFPQNEAGEYVGYKTDHDPAMRATSCGPLTSKLMTEALEKSVLSKNIPIIDHCRVIRLFTENSTIRGCAALCEEAITDANPMGLVLFSFENMIWAAGGPSAIYQATVYPESQTCAHGVAFYAGASGENLTESQYGIASVKFRWNLSGTYQQVLPRYISVDKNGVEREFLSDYFPDPKKQLTAIFLKGYEWPFDPRKIRISGERGSSSVDLAVFAECERGNKVYLDFTRNPSCAEKADGSLDSSLLEETPYRYLSNSGALLETPIARLTKMNPRAIRLYADHGIDLTKELLEIAVCAQHNNGGLAVNTDWENPTLRHFFPVGEAAGTFGICRPGGTALNSTQVGSFRAAQKIAEDYHRTKKEAAPAAPKGFFASLKQPAASDTYQQDYSEEVAMQEEYALQLTAALLDKENGMSRAQLLTEREKFAKEMSACGAFLRRADALDALHRHRSLQLAAFFSVHRVKDTDAMREMFINYDILLTQYVYSGAMLSYLADGGLSRGSAVYTDKTAEELLADTADQAIDTAHKDKVGSVRFDSETGDVVCAFSPVRPIPDAELWFENVYNRKRGD